MVILHLRSSSWPVLPRCSCAYLRLCTLFWRAITLEYLGVISKPGGCHRVLGGSAMSVVIHSTSHEVSATDTWYTLVGSCLQCRGTSAIWFKLSAIGDILRHQRLSLFGHVARLDPGVPAHDALRLLVDTYKGRKPMASWRRPPGRPHNVWLNKIQEDTNALLLYLGCGDLRSHGVMERRNGSLRLCDDDDDDDEVCKPCDKNGGYFSRHLQAVRNHDCSVFENHWHRV